MSKTDSSRERDTVWVRRDAQGNVLSASLNESAEHTERVSADDASVASFVRELSPRQAALAESDLALIRVIEDIVDALIQKEVLRLTDLPERVQAKLLERRQIRGSMRSLRLLGEGQDTI